jgi:RNA polymerase sigma-19 factor, ECF subfamily
MTPPDWSQQIAAWADEWHDDLVKFLARRTATPADAQDLAQEVYLRLLRVDRQDLVRQPRSYLLRIAANLLHEWRLKARQARPHETDELNALQSQDDPEHSAMAMLRARRLTAELDQLPEPVRAAIVLQVRDGLSYEEIATKMNVTPRMIKRYLLTAYASLRARVPSDL